MGGSLPHNIEHPIYDNIISSHCRSMEDQAIPRLKIVVLGNSGVGKTSIIHRWVSDTFTYDTKQTIGSNHQKKRVFVGDGEQIDLYIWDTAGQERFHALMPLYTRSSDLAVLTTAINDENSFAQIPKWLELISASCDVVPPIVLAVNKKDLVDEGETMIDDIHQRYAAQFRSVFFVSAKTGENCESLIQFVGNEATIFNRGLKEMTTSNLKGVIEEKQGCC
jgi:small GTP-binding protein